MSSDEKGPSKVAALGFRVFRLDTPLNGELAVGTGAAGAVVIGFIGVAGASKGGPAGAWERAGAAELRFPMLKMAGSTNGSRADWTLGGAGGY
jgi:hypothetical protein